MTRMTGTAGTSANDGTAAAPGQANDLCRAMLESATDGLVVLTVPGTDYQLHLVPVGRVATEPGKRVRGRIRGQALRLHVAQAGGKFIEPVYGHPRIVQGTVMAHGSDGASVLVDMVVPAWLSLEGDQRAADFPIGTMVNMYVASGMTFEEVRT